MIILTRQELEAMLTHSWDSGFHTSTAEVNGDSITPNERFNLTVERNNDVAWQLRNYKEVETE